MGFLSFIKKSNQVYFPDNITYFKFPEIFETYKKIYSKLKISYFVLDNYLSCGLQVLEAGYENEARKIFRENFSIFNENNVKNIITNSPEAYKVFTQDYKKIMPDWDLRVTNVWSLILERLLLKPKIIKQKINERVLYHDSCYLGRYSGIYNEPREILNLLGYNVIEFQNSKEKSFSSGSSGGLVTTNPKLADLIAQERILQAKRLNVKKIIVSSVNDYSHLSKNTHDSGIEIIELSEVLALGLGIKRIELKEEDFEETIDIENE